jgi:hypothetical protein
MNSLLKNRLPDISISKRYNYREGRINQSSEKFSHDWLRICQANLAASLINFATAKSLGKPREELQGITPTNWQNAIKDIDKSILGAYENPLPKEAIKIIATIWEQLERTEELAAARSRLLLGRLPKPILGTLPQWFEKQKTKILTADEDEIAADPCAVSSAELLVRAVVAACLQANDFEAEIETGPRGRVVIDWYVPDGRLQWMVEALDIPWPAVKVYEVSHIPKPNGSKSIGTHIFFNVFDAIDSFKKFLSNI